MPWLLGRGSSDNKVNFSISPTQAPVNQKSCPICSTGPSPSAPCPYSLDPPKCLCHSISLHVSHLAAGSSFFIQCKPIEGRYLWAPVSLDLCLQLHAPGGKQCWMIGIAQLGGWIGGANVLLRAVSFFKSYSVSSPHLKWPIPISLLFISSKSCHNPEEQDWNSSF